MKPKWISFLLLILISAVLAVGHSNTSQSIIMVGSVEEVTFGVPPETLVNSPNGHISFQKIDGGYRVWIPGRLPITPTPTPTATPTSTASPSFHEEGGFLFDVKDWPSPELPTPPTFVLGHVVDDNHPNCGAYIFDRNYKALNAIVPGASANTLFGFYDAEYHVACASEPLLSSIGMATSTDGGISWNDDAGQIIQGLDEANLTAECVTTKQLAAAEPSPTASPHIIDCGASGPSAVVRNDGYIYLYYADRTPLTGGPDSIYVARAQVSASPPLVWQKWDGGTQDGGWTSDQRSAAPIIVPATTVTIALQPHVSWNTYLNKWLMVFKTAVDFELATSVDGVHWNPPVSLLTFDSNDKDTGFPTLISTDEGETSQQYTGPKLWLYYSSLPKASPVPTPGITPLDPHHYHGHFVEFIIDDLDLTPPVTTATVTGPFLNGWYTGPTTVSFTATDDFSGVASTQYSLDNGATWSTGNSALLTTSGIYNVLYRSIDVEANVEIANSISVRLDVTPPDITASPNHPIIFNNVPLATVTISGTVADTLSGVDRTSGTFVVHDEYGKIHLSGPVSIAADGTYSFAISLRTFVRANDTDGRLYTIRVSAADKVGNSRTIDTFVTAKRFKAPPPPCKPNCV
jgi:hypothetical protein